MADILGLVLPFFGLIFAGFVLARLMRLPLDALGWMNAFILYLALPALFVQLLARTPFERLAEGAFILGSVASTFVVFLMGFGFSALAMRDGVANATMRGLASAYGNIGYMGPGLALVALGPEAAVPVALIFCFENVMHFTLAPLLMALAGRDQASLPRLAGDVAAKILLHPFVLATVAGVGIAYGELAFPVPIERFIDLLARGAAPCALFAMGVTLALRPSGRAPVELLPILFLKLLVHPALVYLALGWVGAFEPSWVFAAVLLAALPTATNVFVIANQYGVWTQRASAAILLTTCASVLTLTGLIFAATTGLLPPDPFP